MQPGGHIESTDATLAHAALREAREETGLATLGLPPEPAGPFDLHRHALSAAFGTCREHLDVAYLAVTEPEAAVRASAESDDVAWWPLGQLPETVVPDLPARLARARAVVRVRPTHPRGRRLLAGLRKRSSTPAGSPWRVR